MGGNEEQTRTAIVSSGDNEPAAPLCDGNDHETWSFEVPASTLREIKALHVLSQVFDQLDEGEIRRIIRWLSSRFHMEDHR